MHRSLHLKLSLSFLNDRNIFAHDFRNFYLHPNLQNTKGKKKEGGVKGREWGGNGRERKDKAEQGGKEEK